MALPGSRQLRISVVLIGQAAKPPTSTMPTMSAAAQRTVFVPPEPDMGRVYGPFYGMVTGRWGLPDLEVTHPNPSAHDFYEVFGAKQNPAFAGR